ncbi:unnamed protein product [Blepharisma stoltei]|uniref:Uncharacterized protein n=1 Tax=Blepharisma stoltei TaxID=1481888 RepID=A0AAU9JD97_9CILI|nr:unnamed protein product [Blepharisma stoltei]
MDIKVLAKEISEQDKELLVLKTTFNESEKEKDELKKKFERYESFFDEIKESLQKEKDVSTLARYIGHLKQEMNKKQQEVTRNQGLKVVSLKFLNSGEEMRSKSYACLQKVNNKSSSKDLLIRISNKSPYYAPPGLLTITNRKRKKSVDNDSVFLKSRGSPTISDTQSLTPNDVGIDAQLRKLKERMEAIIEYTAKKNKEI